MAVDLHIHSKLSDGCCSRDDILKWALKRDLKAISFTDHDFVDHKSASVQYHNSLTIISGVELSVRYGKKDVHILGYLIDPQNSAFLDYLRKFQDERVKRVFKIVEKLNGLNIDVGPERILKIAEHGAVGRPHIARAIVEAGYYATVDDVFKDILMDNGPAWVDKYRLNLNEAIDLIHEARGLAFSAHPGADNILDDLDHFYELGIDGLEAFHPKHSPEDTARIVDFAKRESLLISGGSDFHGLGYGEKYIGDFVIDDVYFNEILKRWKEKLGESNEK